MSRARRVLVTGASGQVGSEVVAELERRRAAACRGGGLEILAAGHQDLDVSRRDAVAAAIYGFEPDIIIHPAAFTAVDACESEVDRAFAVNALGTRHVAEAARAIGAHLSYVSTDYVFDGRSTRPYREWDPPNPLSVYGASKLAGEQELEASATIVRTAWVCGRNGANMAKTVLRLARSGSGPLRFVADQQGSPTIAQDLAHTLVDLSLQRRPGIFHVTNEGSTTWFGFARAVLAAAGEDPGRVEAITTAELTPPRPAPRPANSVLDHVALRAAGIPLLPEWETSLRALVCELARP